MERRALLRSLSYAASCKRLFLEPSTRSMPFLSTSVEQNLVDRLPPSSFLLLKRAFSLLPRSVATSPNQTSPVTDYSLPIATGIGSRRLFSVDVSPLPVITDPDVKGAFKDLMAASWDELPDTVTHDAKAALSKNTEDKAGQEALANVFRAAEAVEQFAGVLVSLRMELDDSIGLSGEKVGHLTDEFQDALHAAYTRYVTYLDAFGPDETYLRKKVEMELGTKMIHIKMRCSGLGSEWGKVTVLGTSGIAGSYVEHRAP
ncbi:succinate dehydrogenase subunit 5, mitochondrial [Magnolia sinica]|uniref:succinate dehydrogenase subunit 5, mitochondrial n=1 Tax=Magnolia sinica TaxID=86752 RepID=UPI00265A4A8D|nr:succinate dehydrogenase subunit 5, mitochondrial [Magnolia sinica]